MAQARVLVVDDEVDVVRAITIRLRAAGYEVLVANDGLMATQQAVRATPDVVVLDIGMPCGDGHTVAQRLRNNPETSSIPVIFLTARTAEEDRTKAASVSPAGYLTKPFRSNDLLDAIKRAVMLKNIRTGDAALASVQ